MRRNGTQAWIRGGGLAMAMFAAGALSGCDGDLMNHARDGGAADTRITLPPGDAPLVADQGAIPAEGGGAAAGDAAAQLDDAGAEGPSPACDPPPRPKPGNVIDLADEGLKPGDAIDGYLASHFKSGNEVVIPAGSYRWNGKFGGDFSGDAILRAAGGQAVLEAPDGTVHNGNVIARGSAHVLVENVTFKGVAAGGKNRIAFYALSANARIEAINLRHPDGSPHDGHPSPIGFYVPSKNEGSVLIKDCYVANFPNNGIYIADHSGKVVVDGCLLENNAVDNLRMDGNDEARNLLIRMKGGKYNWGNRGLRFRYPGKPTVKNVHILTDRGGSPIQTGSAGRMTGSVSATLQDVFIENNEGAEAINMQVGSAKATNVHITGSGSHATSNVSGDLCKGAGCTAPLDDIDAIRALGCAP